MSFGTVAAATHPIDELSSKQHLMVSRALVPANAIPAPEGESPQTPFTAGTAGERVKCARG